MVVVAVVAAVVLVEVIITIIFAMPLVVFNIWSISQPKSFWIIQQKEQRMGFAVHS